MKIWTRPVGPFAMNTYMIWDEQSSIGTILDPGDEIDLISAAIEEHGVKIEKILLTHGHLDHLAQAEVLHKKLGVPMLLHPDDLDLARAAPQQALMFGLPPGPTPEIDGPLEVGTIEVGPLSFEVVHTPGHSPGSVTLIGDGVAFVGDVIFAGSIGRTDLPGGSLAILRNTILEKILPLPDEMKLYPGHGPATTVAAEKRQNPFVLEWTR